MPLTQKRGNTIKVGRHKTNQIIQDFDQAKVNVVREILVDGLVFAIERSPVLTGDYLASWEVIPDFGAGAVNAAAAEAYVLQRAEARERIDPIVDRIQEAAQEWGRKRGFNPDIEPNPSIQTKAKRKVRRKGTISVKFNELSKPFQDEIIDELARIGAAAIIPRRNAPNRLLAMKAGKSATVYIANTSEHAMFVERGNGKTKPMRIGDKLRQYLRRRFAAITIPRP